MSALNFAPAASAFCQKPFCGERKYPMRGVLAPLSVKGVSSKKIKPTVMAAYRVQKNILMQRFCDENTEKDEIACV
jgi:hypothetical protein